jgi:hypothetical protein
VFFWSEEHARKHRAAEGGDTGVYLTTTQAAYLTPIMQSGVFGFPRD